jgi:hypothetical protein
MIIFTKMLKIFKSMLIIAIACVITGESWKNITRNGDKACDVVYDCQSFSYVVDQK